MLLKKLTEQNGVSGAEKPIREILRKNLIPYVDDLRTDTIGNLFASKNMVASGPKVMLTAHMDEVGLMITEISSDGMLKFHPIGGIDDRIFVSQVVTIGESLAGVIGTKAIHLQKFAERNRPYKFDQLYIDIGAQSKEEAAKYVKIGDYAYFTTSYERIGEGYIKAKALDNRVGCAILADILQENYDFPLTGVFTVQEEIGLRGAQVAAHHLSPDFAIVIETTIAADTLNAEASEWVTQLGLGPACSLMDRSTIYHIKLIQYIQEIAQKNGIPMQLRKGGGGGNEAGKIHLTKTGIPTLAISVPCRYIHSPVSMMSETDYTNCRKLIHAILCNPPFEILSHQR